MTAIHRARIPRRFYRRWERALLSVLPIASTPGPGPTGRGVLCAVSGGCDSVVLSHLLAESAARGLCRLILAHVNHQLRDAAADDEAFVRRMAESIGQELLIVRVATRQLAREGGWSIEQAARAARLEALEEMARNAGCAAIALGHQMDDQAETLLLRLLRGTGPRGLGAMAPRQEQPARPALIRPLLDFRRQELQDLARQMELEWVEDDSNTDNAHLRNRIRHELLPHLTQVYNPRLTESLVELARLAREASAPLDNQARELLERLRVGGGMPPDATDSGGCALRADELAGSPPTLLTQVLWRGYQEVAGREALLSARHMRALEEILGKRQAQPTAEFHLPGRVRARLDHGVLHIEPHQPHASRDNQETP